MATLENVAPSLAKRPKEAEMKIIGAIIAQVLKNPGNTSLKISGLASVRELCQKYPVYTDLI